MAHFIVCKPDLSNAELKTNQTQTIVWGRPVVEWGLGEGEEMGDICNTDNLKNVYQKSNFLKQEKSEP